MQLWNGLLVLADALGTLSCTPNNFSGENLGKQKTRRSERVVEIIKNAVK
jgi:hypothetical protein